MTAPLAQQTVTVKDPAAVRKRRRRATAGGAADDCFTCTKRNVKCDRRRPYCSQCLDVGNECSGYKTQLTWGVGVASRGKLRGLSLPIAKAPPVAREPKRSPVPRARANSTISTIASHWCEPDERQSHHRGAIDIPSLAQSHSTTHTPYSTGSYDYLSMSHPETSQSMPHTSWNNIQYPSAPHNIIHSPVESTPKFSKFPLPIITDGLSSSVDTVSEVDYLSPMSQTYSREEMPFGHSPNVLYDNYSTHQQVSPATRSPPPALVIDTSRVNNSCPSLVYAPSEPSSSLHSSHVDPFEAHLLHQQQQQKQLRDCDSLSVPEVNGFSTSCNTTSPGWAPSHSREEDIQSPLSESAQNQWPLPREPRRVAINQDLVAKMPFFMDYYKMTMAPAMVFIDGPTNPFKDHIMDLAANSQSLQHAICALAACNLRMKRKLSLGQGTRELYEKLILEKQSMENLGDTLPQDPALAEEIQHRNLAVHLLNQQLNDPIKSSHDSVLATILILCHYRMAESGIAKFHTQFAGVKKILAMRRPQQFGGSSEDVAWMESIFVYFDAISASINDREAQLGPSNGAGSRDGQLLPPGSENLVGCDRELFKTISKLGRLNMLSQHRPVQNMANSAGATGMSGSSGRRQGHGYSDSVSSVGSLRGGTQSLGDILALPTPAPRFDGNGFGSTLDDDEVLTSAMSTSAEYEDRRAIFWAEWKEARQALQNWQFDAQAITVSLPDAQPSQIRDLEYLSEAFRYAAMLYTERLAGPSTPSSNTNFQNLVSQVVYYATSLESNSMAEKFLLWPLFVAGSECVNELQQNIVRSKCKDIMSRSGYMNNLAALDVLERLWAGDFTKGLEFQLYGEQSLRNSGGRGPFNWAKCFGGPGAGVEWIMF